MTCSHECCWYSCCGADGSWQSCWTLGRERLHRGSPYTASSLPALTSFVCKPWRTLSYPSIRLSLAGVGLTDSQEGRLHQKQQPLVGAGMRRARSQQEFLRSKSVVRIATLLRLHRSCSASPAPDSCRLCNGSAGLLTLRAAGGALRQPDLQLQGTVAVCWPHPAFLRLHGALKPQARGTEPV